MTQETSKPIGAFRLSPLQEFPRRELQPAFGAELWMLALAIITRRLKRSPYFQNNLLNLFDQSVVTGIVAIGTDRGIDLSVGSVVGLTGVILGLSLHAFHPHAIALATRGRWHRALSDC